MGTEDTFSVSGVLAIPRRKRKKETRRRTMPRESQMQVDLIEVIGGTCLPLARPHSADDILQDGFRVIDRKGSGQSIAG